MKRADRRDPLLAAGFTRCPTCGRRSYAADAVWLDSAHILATYTAGCWHSHPATLVVQPGLMTVDDRDPEMDEPHRCAGTVRQGRRRGLPCLRKARPGSDYCACHAATESES